MSYFYGNSLHIKLEEEGSASRAVCSDIYPYPAAMIPTRADDSVGQYPSNGYTTPNVSYTLVPQTYMWASDPAFVIQNQEQNISHPRNEVGPGFYPKHENLDPESRSRKRRHPTATQRRAANVRERRRMFNLNEAFDLLRRRVPTFAYEKRLSRIETLRLAISYIGFMTDIINGGNPEEIKFRVYRNHTGHDMSRRHANVSLVSDENCLDSTGDSTVDDSNSHDQEIYSEYESYGDD